MSDGDFIREIAAGYKGMEVPEIAATRIRLMRIAHDLDVIQGVGTSMSARELGLVDEINELRKGA